MKKFIPLAIVAAAVGAAAAYLKNNQKHIDRTLQALDELSESAEETVVNLADGIQESVEGE